MDTAPRTRRVLVVDDHPDSADVLAALLRTEGHEVTTAHDGAVALDTIASWQPEVVILDINLPSVDGFEIARRLAGPGRPTLIALTGRAEPADVAAGRAAGFDHYVVKPIIEPDRLCELVRSSGRHERSDGA